MDYDFDDVDLTPRQILNLYKDGFVGSVCDPEDTAALLAELPTPVFGASAHSLYGSGKGKLSLPLIPVLVHQKSRPRGIVFLIPLEML
mgnify:CR=1 FL=1